MDWQTPAPSAKINLLILASTLWNGGAESVIRHLAKGIDRRRFNVTVCHLKERGHVGDIMVQEGLEVVGLGAAGQVDYFSFRKLLRLVRERRIDVIHSHTTYGLVDACLCKLFRPSLRVVHTFHFGNYPHTRPRILWMERVFSRLATRLYAVGEVQRGQVRAVLGVSDRRIGVVWNGVDLPDGGGGREFRDTIARRGQIVVGTIATMINQKGLPALLRTARRLKDMGRDVKFVLVGEGHLRPELEALRTELNLEESVVFAGWVTNAAEVALPAFDIFFQPSLWEAMSMVVIEAMAAGKPVVVTAVGENPRVVDHGVEGLLVQPQDAEGMAAALDRLIQDTGLRERMGRAARTKAEGYFTVAHMARAYERAYLEALR